jgi:hypothetical protein
VANLNKDQDKYEDQSNQGKNQNNENEDQDPFLNNSNESWLKLTHILK